MTWGPQLEFLKTIERQTGKTPGGLLERPTLTPNQWHYKDIFDEVSGSRDYMMDGQPLPIPLSEVLSYFEMFHIDNLDSRERILKMIRAQDAGFRKVMRDRAEQEAKRKR